MREKTVLANGIKIVLSVFLLCSAGTISALDDKEPNWNEITGDTNMFGFEYSGGIAEIKFYPAETNLDPDHVMTGHGDTVPHYHFQYDFRNPYDCDCSDYPNSSFCTPGNSNYIPTWNEVKAYWDNELSWDYLGSYLENKVIQKATNQRDCVAHAFHRGLPDARYDYIPYGSVDVEELLREDAYLVAETRYSGPNRGPWLVESNYPEPEEAKPLDIIAYFAGPNVIEHFALVKDIGSNNRPTVLEWKYAFGPVYETVADPRYPYHAPFTFSSNGDPRNFKLYRRDCFSKDNPDYQEWENLNKPACWCYSRQCHGDTDGKKNGNVGAGYWYVGQPDLDVLLSGWLVKEPPKDSGIIGRYKEPGHILLVCADFDHKKHGDPNTGYWRIGQPDLDKMTQYWLVKEPPKGSGTPADCQ